MKTPGTAFFYMRGPVFIITLFILSSHLAMGQKVVEKTLLRPHINLIRVNLGNCYLLELQNSETDEVIIEARLDGEYNNDLLIRSEEAGNTLDISAGFRPNFQQPNDKLSAHKVVSIALHIKAPLHSNLTIYGSSCNVSLAGEYGDIEVRLNDGRCILDHQAENTDVVTQSGNILLNSKRATITATSKYGEIFRERIPKGDAHITLITTTGDIRMQRIR